MAAGSISSEKIDLLIYGPVRPILENGFSDQFVLHKAESRADLERLTPDVLSNNDSPWSADHCADALEVPGVLWCNKAFGAKEPSLVDVAPSILAQFGLKTPSTMSGRSIFS